MAGWWRHSSRIRDFWGGFEGGFRPPFLFLCARQGVLARRVSSAEGNSASCLQCSPHWGAGLISSVASRLKAACDLGVVSTGEDARRSTGRTPRRSVGPGWIVLTIAFRLRDTIVTSEGLHADFQPPQNDCLLHRAGRGPGGAGGRA